MATNLREAVLRNDVVDVKRGLLVGLCDATVLAAFGRAHPDPPLQ